MTGKPRAKTVYIPGEGTWQWRNYSINMRNSLLAVPRTKTGRWTQAGVRSHYFQSATYDEALKRTLALQEKWRAASAKYYALDRSQKPGDRRKASAARKHAEELSQKFSYSVAAFEFGYQPLRNFGPERKDDGPIAASYFRRSDHKPKKRRH